MFGTEMNNFLKDQDKNLGGDHHRRLDNERKKMILSDDEDSYDDSQLFEEGEESEEDSAEKKWLSSITEENSGEGSPEAYRTTPLNTDPSDPDIMATPTSSEGIVRTSLEIE